MRFKELRGLGLSLILILLDIYLCYEGFGSDDKTKLIIAGIFGVIILFSLVAQYYIRILDDCMLMYRCVFIILFPSLVHFKDVEKVTLKSKHHVVLDTKHHQEHSYVFNGHKLEAILNEKLEVYRYEKN